MRTAGRDEEFTRYVTARTPCGLTALYRGITPLGADPARWTTIPLK